jgi:hypothetical protein
MADVLTFPISATPSIARPAAKPRRKQRHEGADPRCVVALTASRDRVRQQAIVSAAKLLLEKAQRGELDSLVYVYEERGASELVNGAAGRLCDDPDALCRALLQATLGLQRRPGKPI